MDKMKKATNVVLKKFYFGSMIIAGFISILSIQSCETEPSNPLNEDELKIVNYVVDDVFENLTYELECKIDPILHASKYYGGNFESIIESGLDKLAEGNQVLRNMNKASALRIPKLKDIHTLTFVSPSLMSKQDTIAIIPDRRKVNLRMSTIGWNDAGTECVMFAERIFSTKNKTRLVYFMKKDSNGDYVPVEKRIDYSY